MGNIIDKAYMEILKQLTLNFNISIKDGNIGSKRSKSKGSSVEFSDYREYIPGDDFRRIDWNALARFEKVFIKLFMEEREAPITLFLDKSHSMSFNDKNETAIKIAAAFAYLALSDYDTVSTVLFDERINASEINLKGVGAFHRIATLLENTHFNGQSNLYKCIYEWQPRFKKGTTIIVSDFMYDARIDDVIKLLAYKNQKAILCHVLSEQEMHPNIDGNIRLIDSETNDYIDILAGADAVNAYGQALKKYIQSIQSSCKKYGVEYLLINSGKSIEYFLKDLHKIVG